MAEEGGQRVLKNIVGDWGSALSDGEYACALAALGVLEATGSHQHRPGSDRAELVDALRQEFRHGDNTAVWRRSQNVNKTTTVASWRETEHTDAAALAEAWREYLRGVTHPRQMPRLALMADWRHRSDLFDFDALCTWLKHRDVGLQAFVLADGRECEAGARWHWPLRVGVPAGKECASILDTLRKAQQREAWIAELSQCFAVGDARDACDLLILTSAAAAAILSQPRSRIRARFVACIETSPPALAPLAERYAGLRARTGAAGVAAVYGADGSFQLSDWFTAVLREVSHDLPIHAAVWGTGQWRFNVDPLIFGDPGALDACRILSIAERQDRIVAALEPAAPQELTLTRSIGSGDDAVPTFGGATGGDRAMPSAPSPGPSPIAHRGLADALRNRRFVSESVDGIDTARDLKAQEGEIDQARPPRWIQANAWRPEQPEIAARSLAPRQWNLLGVHIGPSDVPLAGAVFNEGAIDFSGGEVIVSVQLELSGANVAPLDAASLEAMFGGQLFPGDLHDGGERVEQLLRGPLAKLPVEPEPKKGSTTVGLAATSIVLPPAGDSTLALFAVFPEGGKKIDGRIAIIHKNRILQTARLSVGVGTAAARGAGLDVIAEAPIHPRDDDLDERRDYDVAIQLSDVGGKLHLKVHRNGRDTPVQLDALQGPIGRIQKGLENAARSWDYAKPVLQQPVLGSSLRTLAAAGSELAKHLRDTCGDDIDLWERVHLVPYTKEFLPLEYVYDGPPPSMDASPCPNLLGGLDRGACDRALGTDEAPAPCPNSNDGEFVCPMHFWGFRRLIERNGALRPAADDGAATASTSSSTPSKRTYGKVGSLLFAASERAFRYEAEPAAQAAERAALVQALGVLGATVTDVADWKQWRTAAQSKPDMLVLVAHTDVVDETPVLEIGAGKILGRHEISAKVSGAAGEPQILLLLGCSAADVTENFQPYPECFRDAGVSIVLAPVAPIRGKDAVPIAKRIVQRLADRLAQAEPTSFGELMPLLRRELLFAGHPGVMGLVGFGDGDWLLGGQ